MVATVVAFEQAAIVAATIDPMSRLLPQRSIANATRQLSLTVVFIVAFTTEPRFVTKWMAVN